MASQLLCKANKMSFLYSDSVFFAVFIFSLNFGSTIAQNSPPVLNISRDLKIKEDAPVNTTVTWLDGLDNENDPLTYHIVPSALGPDMSSFFRVASDGNMVLAKPLTGMGGRNFFLGVSASDGLFESTSEVRIYVIKDKDASNEGRHRQKWNRPPVSLTSALNPFSSLPSPALPAVPAPADMTPWLHLSPGTVWTVSAAVKPSSTVSVLTATNPSDRHILFQVNSSSGLLQVNPEDGTVTVAKDLRQHIGRHRVDVAITDTSGAILTSETVFLDVTPANSSTKKSDSVRPEVITHRVSTGEGNEGPVYLGEPVGVSENEIEGTVHGASASSRDEKFLGIVSISVVVVFCVIFLSIGATWICWKKYKQRSLQALVKEISVVYNEKEQKASINEGNGAAKDERMKGIAHLTRISRLLRRFRSSKNVLSSGLQENGKASSDNTKKRGSLKSEGEADKWEFPRKNLRFLGNLGQGCFGLVLKCEAVHLQGVEPMLVAVKTLKASPSPGDKKDLLQELSVLKSLPYHPNVVPLLGCCTETDPVYIILEFMVGGKLKSFLQSSRSSCDYGNLQGQSSCLSAKDLIVFSLQIARGMEFLSQNRIIHRDLAARNVLVGKDKVCKVADFGLARDVSNNAIYERKSDNNLLPIRWMAPESLFDNQFTVQSDVWSFGILLWEIITLGATPYPGMSAADVMVYVKDGKRLRKPEHCRREVYNIMSYCWTQDPNKRIKFSEIVLKLESLILSEVDYIELVNFPSHTYYNCLPSNGDVRELV